MKYVLTHYATPENPVDWTWAKEYASEIILYNRTPEDIPGAINVRNMGDADYDKLCYIVDNYDNLPDVFLLSKSNLFKYCPKDEFDLLKDRREFTPLLSQHHKTYSDERGQVCYYEDGWYWERNDSWYVNAVPTKYFNSYQEFAKAFFLPNPKYLPFAPGGSYIVTKDRIHRFQKEFYEGLRDLLPYAQRPGEAHMIERSYGLLWGDFPKIWLR